MGTYRVEPEPTTESVARFANASTDAQLSELTRLRRMTSASDRASVIAGALAIYLAFSAIMFAEGGGRTYLNPEAPDETTCLVVNTLIYAVGLVIGVKTAVAIGWVGLQTSR